MTVVLGDGTAGAVGAGRPEAEATTTAPGNIMSAPVRGEHEQGQVREPVCNPNDNLAALRQSMPGDERIPTPEIEI